MAKETRIQKVLSDNGILSRRKAEEHIKQGRITVNGRPAQLGHAVDVKRDIIAIDGEKIQLNKKQNKIYVMLNKPRGYVTTMEDELGRRCVAELVDDTPEKVYPIGRLDKDSEGLILLTNDGEFANRIMHPSSHIGKTYRVTVRPDINDEQALKLSTGVEIDGKMTLPAVVHVISKDAGRVVLQITIYEGKNRQIRKMCEAVGLEVARLRRVSIGPIKLGMLKPGAWRELKPAEVISLRNAMQKVENQLITQSQQEKAEQEKAKYGRRAYNQRDRKPYGDKSFDKSGDKKPYDKKPYGDKSFDKSGDKKSYDKKPYGDKSFDKSGDKKPYDKKPYGDKSFDKSGDKKPYDKKPYGDKSFDKSGDKKPYDKKPYGDKSFDKSGDKKPYDKKPYGDKSFDKSGDKKPYDKKPYGDKSFDKSGDKKPFNRTTSKPSDKTGAKNYANNETRQGRDKKPVR